MRIVLIFIAVLADGPPFASDRRLPPAPACSCVPC
jgi:hypothetical protein